LQEGNAPSAPGFFKVKSQERLGNLRELRATDAVPKDGNFLMGGFDAELFCEAFDGFGVSDVLDHEPLLEGINLGLGHFEQGHSRSAVWRHSERECAPGLPASFTVPPALTAVAEIGAGAQIEN
jgi:hypothetical protein